MIDFSDVNVEVLRDVYEEITQGWDSIESYQHIKDNGWGDSDEKRALRWLEENEFIRPSLNCDDEKCCKLERFFRENEK